MGLRAHPRIVPYPNWYGRPKLVGSPRRGDRIGLPFRPARRANPAILESCFVVDARFTDAPSLSSLLFITLATPHYSHYGSLLLLRLTSHYGSPPTTAHLPLRLTSHYAHHGRTRRRMCWGQSPRPTPHPHGDSPLVRWGTIPSARRHFPCFRQCRTPWGQSPHPTLHHHGDSPQPPSATT